MKQILLLSVFVFFFVAHVNAQLMADFEELTPVLESFSQNGDYTPGIIENPLVDNNNPSDFVFGGASVGGVWEGMWFDTEDFLDFTNSLSFTMLVYGEVAGTAMIKIEDKTDGAVFIEVSADYTDVLEWQELTFTFDLVEPEPSTIYNRVVVFLDFGSEEVGNLWYFDKLIGPAGHEETSVEAIKSKNNNIYPNPFTNQLQVTSANNISEVSLFNLVGQNVLTVKEINASRVNIETEHLQYGVYFMKTKNVNGTVSSSKLIKK